MSNHHHPTDPEYLSRWLRVPRDGFSPARRACAVERYRRPRSHWLAVVVTLAAFAVLGVMLAWRG